VPLYHSDAFVLRTYKLGERDQIVVFFTRDFGKIRAVARRSHSSRRPHASYYQPLMLLRAILFGRPSRSLFRVNSVDVAQTYRGLHEDFGALRSGLYLTELLDVTTREHEPVPELFELFHATLDRLVVTPQSSLVLRQFELYLLMHIGYTPQFEYCARCDRDLPSQAGSSFSPRLGGLVCASCASEVRPTLAVSSAAVAFLRRALGGDEACWTASDLDTAARQELEDVLHAHLVSCLGRELKSYAFLHL
jgi:DNA repair protein RecO (recombination protein O)